MADTQTSTTVNSLSPTIDQATTNLLGSATDIANRPYPVFPGPRVADLSGNESKAIDAAAGTAGAWKAPLTSAMSAFGDLASGGSSRALYDPTGMDAMRGIAGGQGATASMAALPAMVNAGSLRGMDLSGYVNPYMQPQIDELRRQSGINRMGIRNRAIGSGAFGGSRSAVMEGMEGDSLSRNIANLLSGAYGRAQDLATTDLNRAFSADTTNQGVTADIGKFNAGLGTDVSKFNAGQRLTASDLLSKIGQFDANYGLANADSRMKAAQGLEGGVDLGSKLGAQDLSNLLTTGGLSRSNTQAGLDTQYQDFMNQFNYPTQGVNLINGVLHGIPTGSTSTTTAPGPNTFAQNLGGFGTLAAGAGTLYNAVGGAKGIGDGISSVLNFFR